MTSLHSSQLAEQGGVNVQTLRNYEREGLLPRPPRPASGYRTYPSDTVDLIRSTRKIIAEEIERMGKSTVIQEVTDYVKHDRCACEIRNPQGSCCLGNLAQTVKQERKPENKGEPS